MQIHIVLKISAVVFIQDTQNGALAQQIQTNTNKGILNFTCTINKNETQTYLCKNERIQLQEPSILSSGLIKLEI